LIIQARGGRSLILVLKTRFFGRESGDAVIENPLVSMSAPRGAGSRGCSRGMVFAGTGGERVDWRRSGHITNQERDLLQRLPPAAG